MQQLLSTGSLSGAQRLQCSRRKQGRFEQGRLESRRLCALNNNDGQLSPTESTAKKGVKIDAPSRADNYLTRQRDTVINRRAQLGRWPPPVERYDSRLCADLYPYWQDIWLKMPQIKEEEDLHSTAITSSKVSSLKTGVITPLSSSEIFFKLFDRKWRCSRNFGLFNFSMYAVQQWESESGSNCFGAIVCV